MKRIEIAGLPANATAYELEDGSIYRIHLDMKTPVDQLVNSDFAEVETRGYLIDKSGSFLVDDNQEPIMLPAQRARVPLANVRAGTDTAKPGWVLQTPPEDESALEGVKKLKHLPKNGEPGDRVLIGEDLYAYGEGLYESVRRSRLEGLTMHNATPAQEVDVESLLP